MRFLITGAAGMLGSAVVPALLRAGHHVVATDIDLSTSRPWGHRGPTLAHLDVRSREELDEAMAVVRPDMVAHLAAETDLEICEQDQDHAYQTNTIGTRNVALACRGQQVPMIYIGTAGIFDGGKEEPYDEFDDPAPINHYGRSKYLGEAAVQQLVPEHYIVRAGWMVGGGAKDHKFVARIAAQLAEGRTTIHAVHDKRGTPTYAPDFAACLTALIATGSYGLYHMAGEGDGTRLDVAAEILDVLGRHDVELVGVDSSFFADEFWAARPHSEIMRNRVLDLQGMNTMRPWRTALREYLTTSFPGLADDRTLVIDEPAPAMAATAGI